MEDMGDLGAWEASVALEDCTEEACMAMVTVRYILSTSDNNNNNNNNQLVFRQ